MKIIINLVLISFMFGCANYDPENNRVFEFDSIPTMKYISTEISDPRDLRSFSQSNFEIKENARLLIRADDLLSKTEGVVLDAYFKMALNLYIDTADFTTEDLDNILLCPLNSDWLPTATWMKPAHMGGLTWKKPGGDFASENCIRPAAYKDELDIVDPPIRDDSTQRKPDEKNIQEISSGELPTVFLQFEITDWFLDLYSRKKDNFGFAIVTIEPNFKVHSSNRVFSPKIKWSQPRF
ncbi:MAG: hypothetical protein AB8E15_12455 [Bdellovibrionales bacterium]